MTGFERVEVVESDRRGQELRVERIDRLDRRLLTVLIYRSRDQESTI